jgi:Na+-transporting NADH:ubiquinone oxidoreductase subunit C
VSIKDKAWFPILFMFLASVFFVAILVVFGAFTQKRVDANQRIAFERATLQALPLELPEKADPAELHDIFTGKISDTVIGKDTVYLYKEAGELVAYALPIRGPGFWAPIEGVIGIDKDRRTITGISFYKQEETPGLGAEIANMPFRSQFKGKKIAAQGTPFEIRSVSTELDASSVHAVTGATQTSTRLEKFLNERLAAWRDEMGTD